MVILFLDKYSIRRYLIRGKTPAAAAALYTRREEIRSHQTAQKLRHLCWSKLWLYVLNTHAPIHAAPLNIYCCDVLGKYTTLSYYIHSIPDTPNSSKSALSRRAASIVYRVEASLLTQQQQQQLERNFEWAKFYPILFSSAGSPCLCRLVSYSDGHGGSNSMSSGAKSRTPDLHTDETRSHRVRILHINSLFR